MQNLHESSQILTKEKIEQIQSTLEQCWDLQTCSPKAKANWSEQNKAMGQCAITAILIAEMFGGKLAKNDLNNHLWNILPDGSQHDFSRTQFLNDVNLTVDHITNPEEQLNHPRGSEARTKERFELLKQRFNIIGV